MSNGDDALKILVRDADNIIAQEGNMDYSKCSVSPLMPKSNILVLKILTEQMRDKLTDTHEGASLKASLKGFELKNIPPIDLVKIVGMLGVLALLAYMVFAHIQDRRDRARDRQADSMARSGAVTVSHP